MANKFSNRKAKQFLLELDRDTIETSDIFTRSKFNFSFFDPNQNHCTDFAQLSPNQLLETFEKIRHYSRSPLTYWQTKRCGGGGLKILEIYVPHDVKWARFRMDNLGRLVGFVVPPELVNLASEDRKFFLDTNTFYVVFIDLDHRFYKTENR